MRMAERMCLHGRAYIVIIPVYLMRRALLQLFAEVDQKSMNWEKKNIH